MKELYSMVIGEKKIWICLENRTFSSIWCSRELLKISF